MEYQKDRRLNLLQITRAVPIRQLLQGHQLTRDFFSKAQTEIGTTELKPRIELDDTPPPIKYDDEFGKATVTFSKIETGATVMPVFGITYQEEGEYPVHRLHYTESDCYFAETRGGFPT